MSMQGQCVVLISCRPSVRRLQYASVWTRTMWLEVTFCSTCRSVNIGRWWILAQRSAVSVRTWLLRCIYQSLTARFTRVQAADSRRTYTQHRFFCRSLVGLLDGRLAGAHLEAGSQPYHALMGRDFLKDYRMVYDEETGRVTLSRED